MKVKVLRKYLRPNFPLYKRACTRIDNLDGGTDGQVGMPKSILLFLLFKILYIPFHSTSKRYRNLTILWYEKTGIFFRL